MYVLVSGVQGLDNITGVIRRSSSGGVVIEVDNAGCYEEVLAYAYGEDGATGNVPVRTRINIRVCRFGCKCA